MPCFVANACARSRSRLATVVTRPFDERWMAGTTKLSAILAAPSTPQRILSVMLSPYGSVLFSVARCCFHGRSADGLQTFGADGEYFIRLATPPVLRRKDFSFHEAFVPRALDFRPHRGQIDDAIAHHAPVEQHVLRLIHPIAHVVRQNALLLPGRGDRCRKFGIPPAV